MEIFLCGQANKPTEYFLWRYRKDDVEPKFLYV